MTLMLTHRSRFAVVFTALASLAAGALVACSDDGSSPSGNGSESHADGATELDAGGSGTMDAHSGSDATADAADAAGERGAADGGSRPVDGATDGCALGPAGEATNLSCAHLYSDWSSKTVYPDVVPYDPGLHLWSDGAVKQRWIHLPAGQKIDTTNQDEWTFPVGTQLWKEFRLWLPGDAGAPTRIETRMLWKQAANTWYMTTYRWSDDGESSASELTTGQVGVAGTTYEVPTQTECGECHNGRLDKALGFEAVSLSSAGATGLNMDALVAQDLITAAPTSPITIPGNATESTALAWLHANCGTSCHNSNGYASYTGFFMRLNVADLASVQATDTYKTGWNQKTFGFQIPGASVSYRIHACDTASSCVMYRASRRTGVDGTPYGVQMPPIDSHKVDDADLATVAAWIDQGCDADAGTSGDAAAD